MLDSAYEYVFLGCFFVLNFSRCCIVDVMRGFLGNVLIDSAYLEHEKYVLRIRYYYFSIFISRIQLHLEDLRGVAYGKSMRSPCLVLDTPVVLHQGYREVDEFASVPGFIFSLIFFIVLFFNEV